MKNSIFYSIITIAALCFLAGLAFAEDLPPIKGRMQFRETQTGRAIEMYVYNFITVREGRLILKGYLDGKPIIVKVDPRKVRRLDFLTKNKNYRGGGWNGYICTVVEKGKIKITKWSGESFLLEDAYLHDPENDRDSTLYNFYYEMENPITETIDKRLFRGDTFQRKYYPDFFEFSRIPD